MVRLTCPQYLHDGDAATTHGEGGGGGEGAGVVGGAELLPG